MSKLFTILKKHLNLCCTIDFLAVCGNWSCNRELILKLSVSFMMLTFMCPLSFCTYGFARDLPPETVPLSSIKILNKFSTENKYFTINDEVRVDAPYYRFLVKSPHGDYDVLSIRDLFKVCYEIRVIEEYRATDEGSEVWKGAGDSLNNIGRGAKRIVKEPKESAKAFARAGEKLVRSVSRFLKKMQGKEEDETTSDGTDRAGGGRGQYAGKQARKFAAELGLDVYSANPYVQALIQEVTIKRSKGALTTGVGLFFLAPIQGLGLLGGSLTADGFEAETENLIRDESPAELKLVLIDKYKKDLGVKYKKKNALKALLDNPNYSPREQAYLYLYLRRLGKPDNRPGVGGLLNAIDHLGKVDTPDAASFATNQAELLSAYHQHAKDLTEIVATSKMLGAITKEKQLFFIIPYDIVGSTTDMQKFLDKVVATAQAHGAKGTQLWFTGDVMGGFVSKSRSMDVKVKENVLLLPHFAPKGTTNQDG